MALLTKGQAPQINHEFRTVSARELGDDIEILVRGINVTAREHIESLMVRFRNGETQVNWRTHLVIAGMVDPDKRHDPDGFLFQWTQKDLHIVGNWPSHLVDRLCVVIMDLSGMTQNSQTEIKETVGKVKKSASNLG